MPEEQAVTLGAVDVVLWFLGKSITVVIGTSTAQDVEDDLNALLASVSVVPTTCVPSAHTPITVAPGPFTPPRISRGSSKLLFRQEVSFCNSLRRFPLVGLNLQSVRSNIDGDDNTVS